MLIPLAEFGGGTYYSGLSGYYSGYPDFKTVLSELQATKKMYPVIFYYTGNFSPGGNLLPQPWCINAVNFGSYSIVATGYILQAPEGDDHIMTTVSIEPFPSTFLTDFPNAIALNSPFTDNIQSISLGGNYSPGVSAYPDFKTVLSELQATNEGSSQSVFYYPSGSAIPDIDGPRVPYSWSIMTFLADKDGYLLSINALGYTDPTVKPLPPTFLTDFPNAVALIGGGVGAVSSIGLTVVR